MSVASAGRILFQVLVLTAVAATAAAGAGDLAAARNELASTGRLRVGVVSAPKATVFFVVTDGSKPRGVTVDLGEALAHTLDVESEFFVAHNSGEVTDALEKGLLDVAFLPVDDERRKRVEFGPAYARFESTCLVLGSSGFRRLGDLDRSGVRVGGEAGTTTIRAAERALKSATVVAVPSVGEGIEMLRSGRIDAFALGRNALVPYQAEISGSRILDGHFHATGIAIAVPKNRPAALVHARAFLEQAKASGLVRRAFDKAGFRSTAVAPAE